MVKFTDDTAPTGGPSLSDKVPLVDVSDTTDSAEGSSKTDTLGNLIAAAPLTQLSDVDTDKSKTPADGDVLTFDGTDWNAETPAAGGGGMWTLVGTYDNTDFSSNVLSMTGLNGDTDIKYKIVGTLVMTANGMLSFLINNDTTNTYLSSSSYTNSGDSTVTGDFNSSTAGLEASGGGAAVADIWDFEVTVMATTAPGKRRLLWGETQLYRTNTGVSYRSTFGGSWNDTSSNVTSLQVKGGTTVTTGTLIKLYKLT